MEEKKRKLDTKEENLIKIINDIKFGEIKIIIQDGLPIRIEQVKKSIKL